MKTILASAYDVNPFKGSESGTGWNFIFQISRDFKVIAITRENNRSHIEKFIHDNNIDDTNLVFEYFDLPYFLRFWKRGERGSFLYYNLWQFFLPLAVMSRGLKFDIVQHINFHADHVPSFLWLLNKPFVWGPINHNEPIDKNFTMSTSDLVFDRFKFFLKWVRWNLDPFLLLCVEKADLVIGASKAVQERLKVKENKFKFLSTVSANSSIDKIEGKNNLDECFNVLSVGRFVSIKSFDVALNSFNSFYLNLDHKLRKNVKFTIVGKGPKEKQLKNLAKKLECNKSVKFLEWVSQKDLMKIYSNSSVLFVPSHESAGAVVAEALSQSLPVLCFNGYGAGEIVDETCGKKTNISSYEKSCNDFADHLKNLYFDRNLQINLSKGAREKFINDLSWDVKGARLRNFYSEII